MESWKSAIATTALIAPITVSAAADDKGTEALALVRETLPLVCGDYPKDGSDQKVTIKGQAQAQLTGLLKKLADLGVSGAAEFNSEKYVSVLRSELGSELKSVRACREKVYEDFRKIIATGNTKKPKPASAIQQPPSSQATTITVNTNGDGNATIVNGQSNAVSIGK